MAALGVDKESNGEARVPFGRQVCDGYYVLEPQGSSVREGHD